jgi:hypothetical protein
MCRVQRILAAFLSCVAVSACTTTYYGRESSASDGATAIVVTAGVAAAASSSNASVGFVSGTPVPPSAPGGHLTVSSSSSAGALAAVIAVGILASYIVGQEGPKPLPEGTKLLHTCSCYGYKPPVGGETRLADSKP